jgi:hypothetical protein
VGGLDKEMAAPKKNEKFSALDATRRLTQIISGRDAERPLWESELLEAWPYCHYRWQQASRAVPVYFFEQRYSRGRMTQVNSGTCAIERALELAVDLERRADEGKRRRSAGWLKTVWTNNGGPVPVIVPAATRNQPKTSQCQPTTKKKTPR